MKLTQEDIDQWRENPVTAAVLSCVKALADGAKDEWMSMSWEGGKADPVALAMLRMKAEVASDLADMTLEDIEQWQSEPR